MLLCERREGLIQGGGRKHAPLWKKGKADPGWREGGRIRLWKRREEFILGGREDAPL